MRTPRHSMKIEMIDEESLRRVSRIIDIDRLTMMDKIDSNRRHPTIDSSDNESSPSDSTATRENLHGNNEYVDDSRNGAMNTELPLDTLTRFSFLNKDAERVDEVLSVLDTSPSSSSSKSMSGREISFFDRAEKSPD